MQLSGCNLLKLLSIDSGAQRRMHGALHVNIKCAAFILVSLHLFIVKGPILWPFLLCFVFALIIMGLAPLTEFIKQMANSGIGDNRP
jgi:hypothetical protein